MTSSTSEEDEEVVHGGVSTLSVCTYNILADNYCRPSSFPYSAEFCLKWRYRYKLLIAQLTAISADCLMLQEVDKSDEICSALSGMGYECAFVRRTNRKRDGCVLGWKESKLELVAAIHVVDLNFFVDLVRDDCHKRRFAKDNIGAMALLRHRRTGQLLILCTVHLHWDPVLSDVKLWQMAAMLCSIEWFKAKVPELVSEWLPKWRKAPKSEEIDNVHVVFGGDFNSKPTSAVYELALTGAVKRNAADIDKLAAIGTVTDAHTVQASADEMTVSEMSDSRSDTDIVVDVSDAAIAGLGMSEDSSSRSEVAVASELMTDDTLVAEESSSKKPKATVVAMETPMFYSPKKAKATVSSSTPSILARKRTGAQRDSTDVSSSLVASDSMSSSTSMSSSSSDPYAFDGTNGTDAKKIKLIVDRDLRKAGLWLAYCECDVEYLRKGLSDANASEVFGRALADGRVVVSRNKRVLARKSCPRFVCIGARQSQADAFVRVIRSLRVVLDVECDKTAAVHWISTRLPCAHCLRPLVLRSHAEVCGKIPKHVFECVRMSGRTADGHTLDFYECAADDCGLVVYKRCEWPQRIVARRARYFWNAVHGVAADQSASALLPSASILSDSEPFDYDSAVDSLKQLLKAKAPELEVLTAIAVILPKCVFHKRKPLIVGCEVLRGAIGIGDHIFALPMAGLRVDDALDLGKVSSVEQKKKSVKRINASKERKRGALKIETVRAFGRHFDASFALVTLRRAQRLKRSAWNSVPTLTVDAAEACAQLLTATRPSQARHSLALDSCLRAALGSEPKFTNYTQNFQGCLDYVFVSADNCRVVCAQKLPSEQLPHHRDAGDCLPNFLPDSKHPSDHLPLTVEIQLL